MTIYGILFYGLLGGDIAEMRQAFVVGPMPTFRFCFATLALTIESLNRTNPNTNFPELAIKLSIKTRQRSESGRARRSIWGSCAVALCQSGIALGLWGVT